jgi:hypothetical protein
VAFLQQHSPGPSVSYDVGPGIGRDQRNWVWMALILAAAIPRIALAAPALVTVRDKGVKTTCAEEDNVYVTLTGPVQRFEVTARHPAYGKDLKADNYKADFSGCKPQAFDGKKDYPFTPRTVVLYEDDKVRIDGVTYGGYWRPDVVEVEVAGRKDRGFHLLQLFIKHGTDVQEALVLHDADGYWRLRPLPLPQFGGAVYGSSFLVGPVEESTRPYVRIRKVTIDPKALRFHLDYAAGGSADMTVTRIDHDELRMKVRMSSAVRGSPFIALRSMYVAPDNADTAELHWARENGERNSTPVVGFDTVRAAGVSFERSVPSRHNTSAPDIAFFDFDG